MIDDDNYVDIDDDLYVYDDGDNNHKDTDDDGDDNNDDSDDDEDIGCRYSSYFSPSYHRIVDIVIFSSYNAVDVVQDRRTGRSDHNL